MTIQTTDAGPAKSWWRPREYALLLIVLGFAGYLRVVSIDSDVLTFDEQWHLELSTGRGSQHALLPPDTLVPNAAPVTSLKGAPPWYAVWTHMTYVVHPPLYCIGLRLWRDVFGSRDPATRTLSVLWSLAAIALMFRIARRQFGEVPATWAGLMYAAAPLQVWIAQQVRGYAMMQAVCMALVLVTVHLEKADRDRPSPWALLVLGVCALAAMLTHYFAIGLVTAVGLYVLLRFRGSVRRGAVIALIGAAVAYAIVWGPFMWSQRSMVPETDSWLKEVGPNHAWNVLARVARWPWGLVMDYGAFGRYTDSTWRLFSGLLLLAAPLVARRKPELWIWCFWVLGSLGFLAALDLARGTVHLNYARYVALAGPGIIMLFVGMIGEIIPWLRDGAPALLVGAATATGLLLPPHSIPLLEDPDWRQLGRLVDQRIRRSETILLWQGSQPFWWSQVLYLCSTTYSRSFPRPVMMISGPVSTPVISQIRGRTAWLISGKLKGDVGELLPGARVLEQYVLSDLAVCTRVRLPAHQALSTAPASAPLAVPATTDSRAADSQ